MRVLVQRVLRASVDCDEQGVVEIGKGLLLYVCMAMGDTEKELAWLHRKVLSLRIFENSEGRFANTVVDESGELLLIPNFTLYAETKKGTRPYFSPGIAPDKARQLFLQLIEYCKGSIATSAGVFAAKMRVEATLLGPVNIIIDVPPQS